MEFGKVGGGTGHDNTINWNVICHWICYLPWALNVAAAQSPHWFSRHKLTKVASFHFNSFPTGIDRFYFILFSLQKFVTCCSFSVTSPSYQCPWADLASYLAVAYLVITWKVIKTEHLIQWLKKLSQYSALLEDVNTACDFRRLYLVVYF